jgi:membrane associated rhomboid family serine protease
MTSVSVLLSSVLWNLRQIKRSPMSWAWVVVILGIQAIIFAVGGGNQEPARSWYEVFALHRGGVLAGQVWQVLTYGFLHAGCVHVSLNAVFLLAVGSRIEHMLGKPTVFYTMLGGVVGGGVVHLFFAGSAANSPLLVGASGGCMALLLLLTTLSPQSRMLPLPVSGKSLGLGIIVSALMFTLVNPSAGVPIFSNIGEMLVERGLGHWFLIGHACHLGGGVAGWLIGRWFLRPRVTRKRLRRDRERQEASHARRDA